MITVGLVLCAIGVTVGVLTLASIRAERAHQRLQAELDKERRESLDAYEAEEEATQRRGSFSGYPFAKRHR
jgi:hypothetical protein